jgi:hypothetical protein
MSLGFVRSFTSKRLHKLIRLGMFINLFDLNTIDCPAQLGRYAPVDPLIHLFVRLLVYLQGPWQNDDRVIAINSITSKGLASEALQLHSPH